MQHHKTVVIIVSVPDFPTDVNPFSYSYVGRIKKGIKLYDIPVRHILVL